jgi:CheY-like chemotaxis protein
MVHGFAVQSGGAMLLASKPGVGTTVELWLPRTLEPVREAVSGDVAVARAGEPAKHRLRILLVDDDPLVVAGTISMLEELGHEATHSAASGEAALATLAGSADFDLLLTDHMMPGLTGVQLAARVHELYPSLPILIASGYAELDGITGKEWPRLRKPYSLGDLAAALALIAPNKG